MRNYLKKNGVKVWCDYDLVPKYFKNNIITICTDKCFTQELPPKCTSKVKSSLVVNHSKEIMPKIGHVLFSGELDGLIYMPTNYSNCILDGTISVSILNNTKNLITIKGGTIIGKLIFPNPIRLKKFSEEKIISLMKNARSEVYKEVIMHFCELIDQDGQVISPAYTETKYKQKFNLTLP